MMDLILLRHGPAGKADGKRWPDDDKRPLTAKGRKAVKRAVKGLRATNAVPERILTSPALRTRETAEIAAGIFALRAAAVADFKDAHHARSPARAVQALARMRLPHTIAIVGHEPWLGEFLSMLLTGRSGAGLAFAKAGAALVRFEGSRPAKGRGNLVWLLLPEQLSALS